MALTKETLKKDHPDIYNAIFDDAKAEGVAEGKTAAETEGLEKAVAERDTEILGLVGAGFGDEVQTKLKGMIDAKMTAAQVNAAKAVLGGGEVAAGGDQDKKQKILDAIKDKQGDGVDTSGKASSSEDKVDFGAMVKARMDEKSCTEYDAIKHCRAGNEDAYEKWMEGQQKTE